MAGLENLSERDRAVLRSIFDPTAIIANVADDGDTFDEEDNPLSSTDAFKQSSALCAQGVVEAEAGRLEEALGLLNRGVDAAPERAEAYNDRAQLHRLMQNDNAAMADLDHALQLSGKRSRARALAQCQRGVLLRKRGEDDEARIAFYEAAKLGSGFAKKQVAELNPYAALCNKMLSQVMRGEKDIKL